MFSPSVVSSHYLEDFLRIHRDLFVMLLTVLLIGCAANGAKSKGITECPEAATLQASALPKDALESPAMYMNGPAPLYPGKLRSAGIQGRVALSFVVGTNGKVERCSIRVTEASDSGFIANAKETLLHSTFKPGVLVGRKVRALVSQTVNYTIVRN